MALNVKRTVFDIPSKLKRIVFDIPSKLKRTVFHTRIFSKTEGFSRGSNRINKGFSM
jgi:hypothetical protein